MQAMLAAPPPVEVEDGMRTVTLHDPGHDPADFLRPLWDAYWPVMNEPLRSTLLPVFDGVEMTPAPPYPPSVDVDGNLIGGLY